jgi:tRNA(adenine34) deaminase
VVSALRLADADFLNHRVAYRGGVMAEPCRQVLKSFFRARRG